MMSPLRLALLPLALAACTPDDATPPPQPTPEAAELPIGSWVDDGGFSHEIGEESWTMYGDSVFHYLEVDEEEGWLVAENDAANDYFPGLFSKVEWLEEGDGVWFCQSAFDAPDAQAAADTAPADRSDPATGGCGGFPWSRLTPS